MYEKSTVLDSGKWYWWRTFVRGKYTCGEEAEFVSCILLKMCALVVLQETRVLSIFTWFFVKYLFFFNLVRIRPAVFAISFTYFGSMRDGICTS